ncbi:thioredoxin domain-containing protein [Halomonas sp. I5-271120]|uniref:DsbA family protein n=1 Tax=Halomonas sp. I5-271120 TaxID=3061632 RepID=UPI002714CA51|nr:thioredoxin domain-containing protein [Halomonas sp. I5-271120]
MAKQQETEQTSSSNKTLMAIGIGSTVIGLAAVGGVTYSIAKQEETASDVSQLTQSVNAMVEMQKNQADPGEAAKAAVQEHFAAKNNEKRQALMASAENAQNEGVPEDKHLYGNPDARFTIVEFADYECVYCQRFHETPKQIVDGSGGNVSWEFLHFPLDMHNPMAMKEAVAAECVAEELGNKAFWAFSNEAYATTGGNGSGVPDLSGTVEALGMSPSDLQECMSNPEMRQRVQDDLQKGASAGVTGTPSSYIVDNVTGNLVSISGAQPMQSVMQKLRGLVDQGREGGEAGAESAAAADHGMNAEGES